MGWAKVSERACCEGGREASRAREARVMRRVVETGVREDDGAGWKGLALSVLSVVVLLSVMVSPAGAVGAAVFVLGPDIVGCCYGRWLVFNLGCSRHVQLLKLWNVIEEG